MVGLLFPLYSTLRAIELPKIRHREKWLTYWIIYFAVLHLERSVLRFLPYIPFYLWAKTGFLIWCYFPTTTTEGKQGSEMIYEHFIGPHIPLLILLHKSWMGSAEVSTIGVDAASSAKSEQV